MNFILLIEDDKKESHNYGALRVNDNGIYEIAHEKDSNGNWKFKKTHKKAKLPETILNLAKSGSKNNQRSRKEERHYYSHNTDYNGDDGQGS